MHVYVVILPPPPPPHQNNSLRQKPRSTAFISRFFVPGLLCLALFPASFAWAGNTGGEVNKPDTDDYGNITKMTGNDMVIETNVAGNVYGAYTDADGITVEMNTVTVKNGATVTGDVAGGFISHDGNANDNTVTLYNVTNTTSSPVIGGRVDSGNVNANAVTVYGGSLGGVIMGGYAYTNGNANGNTVIINGTDVDLDVYGGLVGGTIHDPRGNANRNSVTIENGARVGGDVNGGLIDHDGGANDNTVTIDGATLTSDVAGGFIGRDGNANGNVVKLNGAAADSSNVFGGYVNRGGEANRNAVTVYGGSMGTIIGGGVYSAAGNANGNTVTTDGARVVHNVYGGFIGLEGNANDNTVTIDRSTVGGDVFGAYIKGVASMATNNRIILASGSVVGGSVGIYNSDSSPNVSNNWLIVQGKGNTARQVVSIDRYRFVVDDTVGSHDAMLSLTGTRQRRHRPDGSQHRSQRKRGVTQIGGRALYAHQHERYGQPDIGPDTGKGKAGHCAGI